jgi:ribosomal protein S18 acetylase RimI-like enzyme
MNALSNTDLSVHILEYEEKHASDFAQLNYEWLNEFFAIEPHDREQLDDPKNAIILPGGQIFFAQVQDKIVGTVALIVEGTDTYELAKMAVTSAHRGQGIGNLLMQSAIQYGKQQGKKKIFLESNTKLDPAIHLYHKYGFSEVPSTGCSAYQRCNIRMELYL